MHSLKVGHISTGISAEGARKAFDRVAVPLNGIVILCLAERDIRRSSSDIQSIENSLWMMSG